ncbi:hypothetical protein Slin15195_G041800 [Septoria linicola]|uniref:Uncharacterized protein n=1 Tax=Septoria linicola TaxID=215465 RepID=A0A9Q9AUB8_9PEZI|nr:hypothetical protein Slin14017_G045310 [Septoria linicola]USW50861.1 hypothetical protein Slin15195_G041800 [Septoria linicola]
MATRRQYSEDWSPIPHKITTRRSQYEPREERVRLPKSSERALQPTPLNIPSKRPRDEKATIVSTQCRIASSESCEAVPDPCVVDSGPAVEWQRSPGVHSQKRKPSPSIASTRQSEVSIGILDYYMRDRSPATSGTPEPPPPTPKINAAAEHFDFGLPATPSPCTNAVVRQAATTMRPRAATNTQPDQPLIPISPPSQPRPSATLSRGYTLFPVIKEVTPPRQPLMTHFDPPSSASAASSVGSLPETTYRPRKESISSSVRTRNDSINSFQARLAKQRAPIPLRILSSNKPFSTPSCGSRSTASTSTTAISPPSAGGAYQSRWSDDTTVSIASPSLAPTPGPRTSFGSLLRRDSNAQYPACFFEDDEDDESTHMLGKKWAWKKSTSSAGTGGRESRASKKGIREIYEADEFQKKNWWRDWMSES